MEWVLLIAVTWFGPGVVPYTAPTTVVEGFATEPLCTKAADQAKVTLSYVPPQGSPVGNLVRVTCLQRK